VGKRRIFGAGLGARAEKWGARYGNCHFGGFAALAISLEFLASSCLFPGACGAAVTWPTTPELAISLRARARKHTSSPPPR
jgi:hypothetical protein